MQRIELKAYAKINLSLDVLGLLENGYHEVSMVMQQVEFHDLVSVKWIPMKDGTEIEVSTNKRYLPTDSRNLAYRAAALLAKRFGPKSGKIRIDIKKQIPVGAGLAGGSADCAAVLHALNRLWKLGLGVTKLCELGAELGSDVPFCIMGQAKANASLGSKMRNDPAASSCARAGGTGTQLLPIRGINCFAVLTKPPISVSTPIVYKGFDTISGRITEHPDMDELVCGLKEQNDEKIVRNMINLLEVFTLEAYTDIMYTKNKIMEESRPLKAMMSGSGPTIFALYRNKEEAEAAFEKMLLINKETFLTKTMM